MSRSSLLVALVLATLCVVARGQPAPPPAAGARAAIASAKLADVAGTPVHFRAVKIDIPPGASSSIAADDGVVYQLAGSTVVGVDGESRALRTGEGLFIGAGHTATLQAGASGPSLLIHFMLARANDTRIAPPPAAVTELYRTPPIAGLQSGTYDISMVRLTFPAHSPTNAPHHRTGAALYHVLSGTGALTVDATTQAKGPGSFVYEPATLVHQWGNPGSEPFTFLVFNLSREGMPAVVRAESK